jgi:NAD-dependent dihydropyrimidine dehydrogenase PreA subunit
LKKFNIPHNFEFTTIITLYAQWIREGKLKVNPDWNKDLGVKFTSRTPATSFARPGGGDGRRDLRFVIKTIVGEENFIDMVPCGTNNYCCGGGGGALQGGYTEQRRAYGKVKFDQIRPPARTYVLAPCHNCHSQIEDIGSHYGGTITWPISGPSCVWPWAFWGKTSVRTWDRIFRISACRKGGRSMAQSTTGAVMVVGGGIAGIQASLDLAESGYKVYMVESDSAIGGKMAQLDKTFPTNDCSMCIISPKLVEAGRHLNIELMTLTEVDRWMARPEILTVSLRKNRVISTPGKCTACGECAKVCPIEIPNGFDMGSAQQKGGLQTLSPGHARSLCHRKKGRAPCKSACPAHVQCAGLDRLDEPETITPRPSPCSNSPTPFPAFAAGSATTPARRTAPAASWTPLWASALHRFLADWDMKSETPFEPEKKAPKNPKSRGHRFRSRRPLLRLFSGH